MPKRQTLQIKSDHESASSCFRWDYDEPYSVYGLIDPDTRQVRYIGLTQCTHRRMTSTVSPSALRQGHPKAQWLRELIGRGVVPELIILEQGDSLPKMAAAEVFWIGLGRKLGWPLTNVLAGGEGHACVSVSSLHADAEKVGASA